MGDNKAFVATTDPNAQLPNAITLATLKSLVQVNKPVAWYWKANLAIGYDPFLVYVWKLDIGDIEFSFIDCATGTLPANPTRFIVPLADLDGTHAKAPSTGRQKVTTGDADLEKNVAVVFLMLNPETMSDVMRKAASDASHSMAPVGAKGKWPGTAGMIKEPVIKALIQDMFLCLTKANVPTEELESFRRRVISL